MSIVKHMEAIFLGAATVVLVTAYATAAASTPAPASYDSQISVGEGKTATVVVTGKRLGVIEKAKLAF